MDFNGFSTYFQQTVELKNVHDKWVCCGTAAKQ